jgi:AcrR family transcriptional regulator
MPTDHDAAKLGRHRSPHAHEAIMDATVAVLAEAGYHRLTIEGVAAHAHVAKTTVYRWWPTKSSLVIEALSRCLDLPPPEPTGDSRRDVRAVIQRIADTFGRPPLGDVLPALAVGLAHDPEASDQLRLMLGPRRAANAAILYSAAGRGDLPHDLDAHLVLDIIAGTILYRCLMGDRPTTTLINHLTNLVLDGQLPRTPPRHDG